jgi:hypothetical protein
LPPANRGECIRKSFIINGETNNLLATDWAISWLSPKVMKSHDVLARSERYGDLKNPEHPA